MVKVIIRILFICLISVSLNFLYQVFFTRERFDGSPILFFPHLKHPTFVIVTFIIGFIFERYIMKSKTVRALAFALLVTLSFIFIAKFIEIKYGYIYEHYYQNTPYENLTHLNEYRNEKDNRLTLGKALKDEGIKIRNIEGGYTEQGYLARSSKDYQKKVYYVNDELYIIFDWDEKEITAQEDKQSIRQAIAKQYGSIPKRTDVRLNHSSKYFTILDEYGMTLGSYIIEPTKNDTFKFIED